MAHVFKIWINVRTQKLKYLLIPREISYFSEELPTTELESLLRVNMSQVPPFSKSESLREGKSQLFTKFSPDVRNTALNSKVNFAGVNQHRDRLDD